MCQINQIDISKIVRDTEDVELGYDSKVNNWLDTGNYALNKIISGSYVKGIPMNRVIEVYGDPSTGKSLLIYHLLANMQKKGGVVILDDTEDSYTADFGSTIGIKNDELIKLSSLTVEDHFEKIFLGYTDSKNKKKLSIIDSLLDKDSQCNIIVALDSLALLSTRHEQDIKFEKPDMIKAKQIRAGLRICSSKIKSHNIFYIISNHVIAKIGVLYGSKKTTPGGSGVPFQASVRLDLSYIGKIKKDDGTVIGIKSEIMVTKNKINMPFKKIVIDILFSTGLVQESGLYNNLLEEKIIVEDESTKKGFFKYKEEQFRKSDFSLFLEKYKEILCC